MLGILRAAHVVVAFHRRQREAVERPLIQQGSVLLAVLKIIHLISERHQEAGVRKMILYFVQHFMPVVLLPVQLLHRLAELRIPHRRKAERVGKRRRRIRIDRRQRFFAAHLILILRLRKQSGDGHFVYIISGSDLRRFCGSAVHVRVCKFRVLRRRPVHLSRLRRGGIPCKADLLLRTSHIDGQITDRRPRNHRYGIIRRGSPVLFSRRRRFLLRFLFRRLLRGLLLRVRFLRLLRASAQKRQQQKDAGQHQTSPPHDMLSFSSFFR